MLAFVFFFLLLLLFVAQCRCAVQSEHRNTDPCVKRYETKQQSGPGRVHGDKVRVTGREPRDENRAEEADCVWLGLCSSRKELSAGSPPNPQICCQNRDAEHICVHSPWDCV